MKFDELRKISVKEHTEVKNGLTYLSWAWAWDEFKRNCPDATYEIKMFDGLPYAYDEKTGYMVFTAITVEGETQTMWLPVMDSANNAMKAEPYTVKGKYKETEVKAATMFDINKTIMRCLVKNMAMFGLGLYIYAGEDLPEDIAPEEPKKAEPVKKYQRPKCEDCGNEIAPIDKNDGTRLLVGDVVKFSKANYNGRVLCKECMKKASAAK